MHTGVSIMCECLHLQHACCSHILAADLDRLPLEGGSMMSIRWFEGDTEWNGIISLRGPTVGQDLVPPDKFSWFRGFVRHPSDPSEKVLRCIMLSGSPCLIYEITRSGEKARLVCGEDMGFPTHAVPVSTRRAVRAHGQCGSWRRALSLRHL